jgi:hypothetical protein
MNVFGAAIHLRALTKNVQRAVQIKHRATHCLIFVKRHHGIAIRNDLRTMQFDIALAGLVIQHPHFIRKLDQPVNALNE